MPRELKTMKASTSARGLSNNDMGIRKRRGIDNAYKGSETMTKVVGDQRRGLGIYDNDGGVGRGR